MRYVGSVEVIVVCFAIGCGSNAQVMGARSSGTAPAAGAVPPAIVGPSTSARGFNANDNPTNAPAVSPPPMSTPQHSAIMPNVQPNDMRGMLIVDQSGAGNPAGLAAPDAAALIQGGPITNLQWLYPYEGTVFPRGMLAPTLMWNGDAPDAVFVHIQSQSFDYKALLKPDAAASGPSVTLPQDVWDKAGQQTNGQGDVYRFEVSSRSGGVVQGPMVTHFNIAQATIKGSIFYNTYSSKLAGAAVGGNVLRIPPGGQAELFVSMSCNGCHSVSADGSRMISQMGLVTGGDSFPILSGGSPNPMGTPVGPRTAFGALYPDGSKYLTTSVVIEVARAFLTQGPNGPMDATLYDSNSGQVIDNTAIPGGALMPSFSPDGQHLVFNDYAIDDGHGLAVMDYSVTDNKASGYKMLTHETDPMRPAWPFFLPDNKAVIYTRTDSIDFSGAGAGLAGQVGAAAPNSDLFIADLASGKVTILAKAMGYNTEADAANGTSYLPFPNDELHHHYFPTVSPVAAGGFFWVFFDTVRHYGNQGIARALWGTAIEISVDGSYMLDPSHPSFFLPGQEFGTGNHRAFAALDPCKKAGDACTSGIDCCGGVCSFPEGTDDSSDRIGMCAPPKMNTCAKRDEKCKTSADCCAPDPGQPANECIAGFCALIQLN